METLTHPQSQRQHPYQAILESVLTEYRLSLNLDPDIAVYLLMSQDGKHFLLMHEGWQGHQRFHGAIIHAELRNDQIWIHYDGSEDGITDDLVAQGIPKEHIVLAFHPPEIRTLTGYGGTAAHSSLP